MAIPSPDAALISAADRILARVQVHGVPLPAALAAVLPGPCLGALGVAVTLPGIGQWAFAPVWVLTAALFAEVARRQGSALRADARDWSQATAARYRLLASLNRVTGRHARTVLLALVVLASVPAVIGLSFGGPARPLALNALAYVGLALAFALIQYARCALPCELGTGRAANAVAHASA